MLKFISTSWCKAWSTPKENFKIVETNLGVFYLDFSTFLGKSTQYKRYNMYPFLIDEYTLYLTIKEPNYYA